MTLLLISTLIIGLIAFPLVQKYFIKNRIYDKVNNRSSHNVIATRSGGATIFITLTLITSFLYFTSNQIFDFSLLLPLGILFTVGLYDDLYNVDFKLKFIFQLIAAKIIIDQGFVIHSLNGLMGLYEVPYFIAQLLSILFIVLIVNAANFTDGIDGLAITETLKCILIVLVINFNKIFFDFNFFLIIIFLSIIPLYYYNFKKNNKVFLGDSGSLLLGGVVSIAILFLNDYNAVNIIKLNIFLLALLCFTYPIIDLLYVISKRIYNKRSPFVADKGHLHHIFQKKGYSHFQCLVILSGISGLFQLLILIYITG